MTKYSKLKLMLCLGSYYYFKYKRRKTFHFIFSLQKFSFVISVSEQEDSQDTLFLINRPALKHSKIVKLVSAKLTQPMTKYSMLKLMHCLGSYYYFKYKCRKTFHFIFFLQKFSFVIIVSGQEDSQDTLFLIKHNALKHPKLAKLVYQCVPIYKLHRV